MPFFGSLSFDGQKKIYQKGWPGFEPRTLGLWSQCGTILPWQLLILNPKKFKIWRAWAVKTKGTKKWHLQTLIQRDLKKIFFCPHNVFVYIFLSRFLMLNGYFFPKTILTVVLEKFHEIPFTNKKVACRRQAMQWVSLELKGCISDHMIMRPKRVWDKVDFSKIWSQHSVLRLGQKSSF